MYFIVIVSTFKLLSMVSSVGTILFTGGEPSLHPEIIKYTLDKMKELCIPLEKFEIVTNIMKVTDEFISVLNSLHEYTTYNYLDRLVISNDA